MKRISSLSDGGKRGRKRRKPEKHTSYAADVAGEASEETTRQSSTPSVDSADGNLDGDLQPATTTGIFGLPASSKHNIANRILDHFRDFSKRTSNDQGEISGENPNLLNLQVQLAKRKLEAMKNYGMNNFSSYLDPTNVVGSNGIIPERTMRQNNWALKVKINTFC